jgi:hypothetical protein
MRTMNIEFVKTSKSLRMFENSEYARGYQIRREQLSARQSKARRPLSKTSTSPEAGFAQVPSRPKEMPE